MQFECKTKKLLDILSNVSLAVSVKSTNQILEGILINCKDNKLKLTAYNLELGIMKEIESNIMIEGSIVIKARLFIDIIRKLTDEYVKITVYENYVVIINSGNSNFTIMGMNSNEFPELPEISNINSFNINTNTLKDMILQTIFSVSQNEQNPIYTGCLFNIENNFLNIISVDGFRLALRKEKLLETIDMKFIVPGKTLNEIQKLIKDDKNDEKNLVKINLSDKHIIFKIYDYIVISRLLEGEFVDYKNIIKSEVSTTIKVNTKDLIHSIEKISVVINDRIKNPVKCIIENNLINFNCNSAIGNVTDILECDMQGNNLTIGFNNKYILDALKVVPTDIIKLEFGNNDSPIKVSSLNNEEFLYIILPVRLKND